MAKKQNETKIMMLKKLIGFCNRVLFNFLSKSGTNFGHFARTVTNKIKPRSLLYYERPHFQT